MHIQGRWPGTRLLHPLNTAAMKNLFASCLLLLASPAFTQSAPRPAADPWPDKLVGRWEGVLDSGTYAEEWHKVDDGTYEGTATLYRNGMPVSTERTRLTLFAGNWLYIAATDEGIASFVRSSANDGTWVFENPGHDFPKRIGYTLKGEVLSAWIDDGKEGGPRMDFLLKRTE